MHRCIHLESEVHAVFCVDLCNTQCGSKAIQSPCLMHTVFPRIVLYLLLLKWTRNSPLLNALLFLFQNHTRKKCQEQMLREELEQGRNQYLEVLVVDV